MMVHGKYRARCSQVVLLKFTVFWLMLQSMWNSSGTSNSLHLHTRLPFNELHSAAALYHCEPPPSHHSHFNEKAIALGLHV